jgi:hypothetical protein
LIVNAGAKARIYGAVDGTVRNRGGFVVIYGTVGHFDDEDPESQTIVVPTARVISLSREGGSRRLH